MVSPLSSTNSAAVGSPALFDRFAGITRLSDFPVASMSALWHLAFSDLSTSEDVDAPGISRLPQGRFPTVLVVLDSVGLMSYSTLSCNVIVAFPLSG